MKRWNILTLVMVLLCGFGCGSVQRTESNLTTNLRLDGSEQGAVSNELEHSVQRPVRVDGLDVEIYPQLKILMKRFGLCLILRWHTVTGVLRIII